MALDPSSGGFSDSVNASVPPRQPYNGPTQQDTSAPAAPDMQSGPAPQSLPVAQQNPAQPSVTTPPVPPSPNQRLHSFVSSVLSGISSSMAGRAPVKYTTDESGKVIADPNQPVDTKKAQLMRIAATGLAGLGAGAQAGGQKSGLANALAGLGAGAAAQTASSQAADKQARQQANDDFERQQQKLLRMRDIASGNMHLYTMIQEQRRIEEDRDPHRAQSLGWAKAAEDAGVPVQYATLSELNQMRESNPELIATHQILPIGMKPVTDPQGNPVMDEDSKPKMEAQFAVIDGLHDGSLSAPASFVSDLQKYGKYAGITGEDNLKAGDDISMQHFVQLAGAITEGKKKELAGWIKPEVVVNDKGQRFERNNNTGELREAKAIPTSDVKNLADANKKDTSGEVTPLEKFKQDREDQRVRIRQSADNKAGQNTDVFGNVSTLPEKEFNKRYDSFNKSKQYQTLGVLQGSYDQFQQAVKDIDSGKLLSGAQSVVQLFNAIGISATPLAGKGFRINENTVKEHVEARGLDQSALQKLEKLETGAVITEKQLKDYAGIAAQVYKNSFINTAKEQKRQLGYIDVLPLGNNEPVDAMTASLYLQTAGGDRAKAESALKKSGWLIPQR
jgi:hypothetical protein